MGKPGGAARAMARVGSRRGRGHRPAVDATGQPSARRVQMSCFGRGVRAGRGPGPDAAVGAERAPRDVVVGGWCFEGAHRLGAHARDAVMVADGVPGGLDPRDPCVPGHVSLMLFQHSRCPAVPPASSTRGGDGGSRAYSPSRAATMPGYEIKFYCLRRRRISSCPDGDQAGSLSGSFAAASASPRAAGDAPALPEVRVTVWLVG